MYATLFVLLAVFGSCVNSQVQDGWSLATYPNPFDHDSFACAPGVADINMTKYSIAVCDPDSVLSAEQFIHLNNHIQELVQETRGICSNFCTTACDKEQPGFTLAVAFMREISRISEKLPVLRQSMDKFASVLATSKWNVNNCGTTLVLLISAKYNYATLVGGPQVPLCGDLESIATKHTPLIAKEQYATGAAAIVDDYWSRLRAHQYQLDASTCYAQRQQEIGSIVLVYWVSGLLLGALLAVTFAFTAHRMWVCCRRESLNIRATYAVPGSPYDLGSSYYSQDTIKMDDYKRF